jgi:hypothetical protein
MNFDDILPPNRKLKAVDRKKNYVVIALDRSGSMSVMKEQAIEFFNSQVIEAQNARGMDNKVCLITFGDTVEVPLWDTDANEVDLLDSNTYTPDGWTALLDAMGTGITKLLQQPDINDENVSVLFITISDGQENHSKEFKPDTIASMIENVNKTNRWTFVYLGSKEFDVSNIAKMNIDLGNIATYDANADGLRWASAKTQHASHNYYASRLQGMTNTSSFHGGIGDDITNDKTVKGRKKTA